MIPSILNDDWIAPLVYLCYISLADIIPISAQLVSMLVVLNHSESKAQDSSQAENVNKGIPPSKRKYTFRSNDPEESHDSSATEEENLESVLPLGIVNPRQSSKTPLITFRRKPDFDHSRRSLSQTFTGKSFNSSVI